MALAVAGCGNARAPAPAEFDAGVATPSPTAAPTPAPTPAGELPAPALRWHLRLPGEPGTLVVGHVSGPVLAPAVAAPETAGAGSAGRGDALLLFASSATGVVAVGAADGQVRWRHSDDAPGPPVLAPEDEIWLPGRCSDAYEKAPAHARATRRLGCVVVADRTGAIRARVWLDAPIRALPDRDVRRSLALGRWCQPRAEGGREQYLLWAHGAHLLAFAVSAAETPAPTTPATERSAPATTATNSGPIEAVAGLARVFPMAPTGSGEPAGSVEHGAHDVHDLLGDRCAADAPAEQGLIVATGSGLIGFEDCPAGPACAPSWSRRGERAVGVAGPVRAGPGLAWIRDQVLAAGPQGEGGWQAPGLYAYVPGSLVQVDDLDPAGRQRLLAWRIDSGIRPVHIAADDGRIAGEGQAAVGIQVLAVARWDGGLAAAVRRDTSLRNDVVYVWDRALRLRAAWPLPRPLRRRVEPVGLTAVPSPHGADLAVFYDGRAAALLAIDDAPAAGALTPRRRRR
ncbi:hypothetical protein [Haliangium sp.]|uniref:hypothetical protein n=1 Tax=Haliangium sp. TaxID=2663208 RepID=UPI003D14EDAF